MCEATIALVERYAKFFNCRIVHLSYADLDDGGYVAHHPSQRKAGCLGTAAAQYSRRPRYPDTEIIPCFMATDAASVRSQTSSFWLMLLM
jgi:hypothetical protein